MCSLLKSRKTIRSTYKVQGQDKGESDKKICVLAVRELNPKPWNPASELKFPCPLTGHTHEVRKCKEFFYMSPRDRWEKLEKGRLCFSCLKPKTICKGRKCNHVSSVPEVLKCAICASWAESKGLAPFSIFFCKQKLHGDSRSSR